MVDLTSSYAGASQQNTPVSNHQRISYTGLPWRTLVISATVFLVTVVIYLGMVFGLEPYLKNQIDHETQRMDELTSNINQSQQKAALDFYSQLYNISILLKSRVDVSPFFAAIEAHTPSDVVLSTASVDVLRGQKAHIVGSASSFDSILASASSWRADTALIKDVSLNTIGIASGATAVAKGTTFSMDVTFAPGVFNQKTY
jgi:hypothetical protein